MLRSLTEKYLNSAAYSPDEGGADDVPTPDTGADSGGSDVPVDTGDVESGSDAERPTERLSVRDAIKKAFADSAAQDATAVKSKKPAPKKEAAAVPAPESPQVQQSQQPQQTIPAPARLSQEAKAEWDKAPETIKQAFVKAEQDMQRGVDELKQKYAPIDAALAPHVDALRQMNATPGEAVNRMFLWFKALAGIPGQAFPMLAKSMGLDWNTIVAEQQGQQGQQPQQQGQNPAAQAQTQIPDELRNYVNNLENYVRQLSQRFEQMQGGFNTIQQDIQTQQQAKTEENLNLWAKGKDYFEEVRQDMARLIQADPQTLVKNGQVDLDAAYERAIYYNPDVRAKVLAKQQQADHQVQQQATEQATTARQAQVTKARRAAVSLPVGGAPGVNGENPASKKPQAKMSVRDSIKAAMDQLREQ